ncbi:MAG: TonB family protein [Candidatus Acidiferrales bacterium]
MQQAVRRAIDPNAGPAIEGASRPNAAAVHLDVDWKPWGQEFRSSVQDFFTGPRPNKSPEAADPQSLRVQFVERPLPLRGFAASCLWHVAAIWLLILPIWGFLPKVQPTLQPPQIELTWYTTPENLPRVLLPTSSPKLNHAAHKTRLAAKTMAAEAAYHSRQTILSVPVRVTHPRQTLIEPNAPPKPPKLAMALPNVVQWAASEPPKMRIQLDASMAAPRAERREFRNAAAPEIPNRDANGSPKLMAVDTAQPKLAMPLSASLSRAARRRVAQEFAPLPAPEIANADNGRTLATSSVDTTQPKLAMPVNALEARAARRRVSSAEALTQPAPEIRAASEGGANLRRLIALSATPALPAPKVTVPRGNLAAPIAMSPEERKPSMANGANRETAGEKEIAADAPIRGAGSLPAAISITGGNIDAKRGGIHVPENRRNNLGLRSFSRTDAALLRRSAPAKIDMAHLDPALPPETIFTGKQIYTVDVSMPNVTSASGSWILNFAELDSGNDSPLRPKAALSGPTPIVKVDPKYPPELIREHVQGEVVLYAIIRKNGSVDSIRVMRSLDPQLDRDAAAALAQWKFRPGTRAGVPVDIEAVVHIPFNYQLPAQ